MNLSKGKCLRGMMLILSVIMVIGLFSGCSAKASQKIKIGSKEFTEQLLLGQITLLALENAGFEVEDRTNVAGSENVRKALETGEIDLYWEYTGTAWLVHLQHSDALTDSDECYTKVKEEDVSNNLVWLDYAPLNNTYTIMLRREDSERLGIKTISDLADYINENPGKMTFAADHEFTVRPDGLPALEDKYGFQFQEDDLKVMEMGIVYKTMKEKKVEVGMGFATDGRIAAFDLVNLEDDRNFFPVYNPAPVVRKEIMDEHPEIADILGKIAKKLDTETMAKLNYEVDIEEHDPREVAEEWLKSEGLIQ